ncbi:sensor domain-containing diguanylate cyclase [Silvimonas soli]|uniref:sensor domain-containing diguanylate cyclase n=1 Tax=Silvimonas soli TaxID=2980100 RepID=UPI0024B3C0D3|nr:diguanylate cyclase [Silvimonas soli]
MHLRSFTSTLFSGLPAKRALLILALLVQGGSVAGYLYLERGWIEAGVVQSLRNVSSMHMRSFEQLETTLNYQLATVADEMQEMGVHADNPQKRKLLLSKETKHGWLDTVAVLDSTGKIIALDSGVPVASVLPATVLANNSFKDSPQYRLIYDRWVESTSAFVARPFAAELGGGGMMTYQMIRSPDGKTMGSVVGFTSLHSLSVLLNTDAVRGFDLGKDGVLAILDYHTREMLYRYTYAGDPQAGHKGGGQTISSSSFRDTRYGPDVKFYRSTVDGLERLVVLAPLHDARWLQMVAQSKNEYLFNWRIQAAITGLVFACICVLQWLLLDVFHQNQVQRKVLEYDALHDLMTGLANRRKFFSWTETIQHQSDRYRQPWSVLALDVDHFKKVNDTYGHDAGDAVLRTLADILRANIRDCDIAARFGGEEFIIGLPQTEQHGAAVVAERIRQALAETVVTVNGQDIRCTVSIGIAEYQPQSGMNMQNVLKQADAALYRAKAWGRNRVVLAKDLTAPAIAAKPVKDGRKVSVTH